MLTTELLKDRETEKEKRQTETFVYYQHCWDSYVDSRWMFESKSHRCSKSLVCKVFLKCIKFSN